MYGDKEPDLSRCWQADWGHVATASSLFDSPESDRDLGVLLALIAQGDQNAFGELYEVTSARIFGIVRRMLQNPAAAEEVTLDIYIQVWKQAGQYNTLRGAPMTWLVMLTRSRSIDWLRSHKWETRAQSLDFATALADSSPSAEETMAKNGRDQLVRSAIDSLDADQRQAIELAFYSGLSHRAIAEKLGKPVGTVKSRIRLGMQHLRDRLRHYGDGL
jgi:RNA polymerase sigma-70 factor (ECF subfamily)